MNGSYAPELTELLKEIIEEIAKNIIKEGQPKCVTIPKGLITLTHFLKENSITGKIPRW